MHDAYNRAIDQLEAYIGAWIAANRLEAVCLFMVLLIVAWAVAMRALDHRS
jgi:hypothetical protein